MAIHDLLFARVEASRLVENRQGNTGLADIMQGCRQSEPLHVCIWELDIQGEADCHSRNKQAVLERSLMIAAHVVKPDAKSVLLDTADDLRCGVLGIRKHEQLAGPYRRKHGCESCRTIRDVGGSFGRIGLCGPLGDLDLLQFRYDFSWTR